MPSSTSARPLGRALVAVAALVASTFALIGTNHASAAGAQERSGVLIGGTPDYGSGPSSIDDKVDLMEGRMGRQADVVRVWHRWDDTFPKPGERRLAASGHDLFVTVRATDTNGKIRYSDIANAAPGSYHHDQMVRWARSVQSYDGTVYVNFQHEPELQRSTEHGTSDQFTAAFRTFVDVFRSEGVTNAEYVWVMTDYSFEVPTTDRRSAGRWYPGDAWVDHLAADAFNWAGCQEGNNPRWQEFAPQIEPFRLFAEQHPDKGLIIAEVGSSEDANDPERKARWIENMTETLKLPRFRQLVMVAYYDQPEPSTPACNWRLDSSSASQTAFRAAASDAFFKAETEPAERLGTPQAVLACWATPTGSRSFSVTWTPAPDDGAGTTYVIHRSRDAGTVYWADRVPAGPQQVLNSVGQPGTYRYYVETVGGNGARSTVQTCGGGGPVA